MYIILLNLCSANVSVIGNDNTRRKYSYADSIPPLALHGLPNIFLTIPQQIPVKGIVD